MRHSYFLIFASMANFLLCAFRAHLSLNKSSSCWDSMRARSSTPQYHSTNTNIPRQAFSAISLAFFPICPPTPTHRLTHPLTHRPTDPLTHPRPLSSAFLLSQNPKFKIHNFPTPQLVRPLSFPDPRLPPNSALPPSSRSFQVCSPPRSALFPSPTPDPRPLRSPPIFSPSSAIFPILPIYPIKLSPSFSVFLKS